VREAKNHEEAVSVRLRSVVEGVRPPAAASPPEAAGLFTDHTPLAWSDIVTSWPDDADLDPEPPSPPPAGLSPAPPPADLPPADLPPADLPPSRVPAGMQPSRAPGLPSPVLSADVPLPSSLPVGPRPSLSSGGLSGVADDRLTRPIDPSAWAAQREPWQPADPAPASEDWPGGASTPPGGISGAGAFSAGRLRPFDPGGRGVRALAAVAVVVVLIAAFLAWRARPRVDPVEAPADTNATAMDEPIPGAAAAASTGPAAEVVVSVGGKVAKPGLIRLPAGSRVADAVAAAGGARPGTDVALLNLARKVVDGEQILVGVAAPPGAAPAAPAPGGAPAGPVNLNTATLAELDVLPGVGPVLAQRIIDARTAQGGFRAVTDLREVDGIGAARYEQLKDLVTV
jgi:competence protein ComEA